jgi:hypothetical protein
MLLPIVVYLIDDSQHFSSRPLLALYGYATRPKEQADHDFPIFDMIHVQM